MHFINVVFTTLITFLSQALANSIQFYNLDSVDRFICWFPDAGISGIPVTYVPAHSQDVIVFPEYGWSGQFHSTYGDCDTPSIVAEVTWQVRIFLILFSLNYCSKPLALVSHSSYLLPFLKNVLLTCWKGGIRHDMVRPLCC
jgi:hypothetical protein